MNSESLPPLATALDVTGDVLASITGDQWTLPTPCEEWSVDDLVRHLVTGNDRFTSALGGRADAEPVGPEDDLLHAYRRSAREVLDACSRPGALEGEVDLPVGTVPGGVALHLRTTDLLVHGWDLVRATGQAGSFPEPLVEQELTFSRAMLDTMPVGNRPFAPPEPVPDDAVAIDRLAALLGRRVPVIGSSAVHR